VKRALAALALVAALGGCTTAGIRRAPAVTARQVSADTVLLKVRFRRGSGREAVRDQVLQQAARETIARGYDWFTIRNFALHVSEAEQRYVPDGVHAYRIGMRVRGYRRFSRAPRYRSEWREREYTVQMFKGPKPTSASGFVASEILSYLAPPPQRP
jgi:hypothetical protein